MDAFVTNNFPDPNTVWLNDGSGSFSDSGQEIGSATSYDAAREDLDGDGDLDALVAILVRMRFTPTACQDFPTPPLT